MKFLTILSLIFFSINIFAATPENGWWWNSKESGRGFNIETQNGVTFIAGFLYDEGGNAIWYTAVGSVSDNKLVADFVKSDNGQCIGCPYTAPDSEILDKVTFTFPSADKGTLEWQGNVVELERFNFSFGDDIAIVQNT